MSCAQQEHSPTDVLSKDDAPLTLKSLLAPVTRSAAESVDSAYVRSQVQSDKDIFMLNRVIFKDSTYILTLKEEDAAFLGISRELYGRYVDYVNRLNEQISNLK